MNEAELVLSEVLRCGRSDLYLNRRATLKKDAAEAVSGILKRRITGEPLQYILGRQEFMGMEFKVAPGVLIPRPETEVLVETALKYVSGKNILDVGTGSGCIAVSLAKLLSGITVTAVDISGEALRIAKRNAGLHGVGDAVTFIKSDLFAGLPPPARFDMIVSNPPYVSSRDIGKLQPEISFEPRIALDGGADGMDLFRRVIADAPRYLEAGGYLIMEMGAGQSGSIAALAALGGYVTVREVVKDHLGIDRVIVAERRKKRWTS